jgi:hypothetical protein
VLDGEAVRLMFGVDGTSGDLRKLLLPMREANLERLLAG